MNNLSYFFSQAMKNIARNSFMTIASLFTITSCLLILGLFTLITLNVNYITDKMKDQCELQLFIDKTASERRVGQLEDEIKTIANVKTVELFTKEDMLDYAREDMFKGREEQLTGFEDDNPFSDSYKIKLIDLSLSEETAQKLERLGDVERVVNKQSVVDTILHISGMVKKISIIIMVLLLAVAVIIMSNTIKLTVFNRRKEINIMKYIGATDRFIKIPFIIEGTVIGFLGALISFALISWGYLVLENYIAKINFSMLTLMPYTFISIVVGSLFLVMGCIIGMLGSMLSMRKHLQV